MKSNSDCRSSNENLLHVNLQEIIKNYLQQQFNKYVSNNPECSKKCRYSKQTKEVNFTKKRFEALEGRQQFEFKKI